MKHTNIKNDSYFNFFDIKNAQNIRNKARRSNDFFYKEQNYAVYASTNFKINDKWDAKAGLRYKYSNLEGVSINDNVATNSNTESFSRRLIWAIKLMITIHSPLTTPEESADLILEIWILLNTLFQNLSTVQEILI